MRRGVYRGKLLLINMGLKMFGKRKDPHLRMVLAVRKGLCKQWKILRQLFGLRLVRGEILNFGMMCGVQMGR